MSDARAEKLAHAMRARVSINQPSLVPARVVRDGAGRVRIQLQRLDDPTLAELLAAGEVSRKDGVRIVYSVAAAVEALRRAGLVARDLRPGRIHFSAERGAVLADTGVPLELMPRTLRPGDPEAAFRSPEERAGKPIGARSNVYSLGVLLRAVLDRPVSSGLPKQVEMVIARATATDPERRFAGPRDFIIAAIKALGLQIRQRPGGGTEFVRVQPEAPAAEQPPKPAEPAPRRKPLSASAPPDPEPAPEPVRSRQPAPKPAPDPEPAPEPVRSRQPAPKPAPTRQPTPEPVRSRQPAPKPAPTRQPAPEPVRSRQPAPEPARSRKPAFSLPSLPRPSLPRPSLRLPSIPRPHLRLPAVPRPQIPRPRKPQLRMPALIGPRVRSQPSVRAFGVVVGLAACVIGGLLLAKLVEEKDGATQLSSGALSVQLPDGWGSTMVDREPSIALSAPVAAAPLGESGTGLVAGRVEDADELDKRLSAEATQRTEVSLGRLEAWRYSGLEPESGLAAVAFLAPTSDGSLLVICHARRRVAPDRLRECEGIASTIALRGARPAALASVGEGTRAVTDVMDKLRAERRIGRRELAGARRAPDQASAARELEASYRDAADSIESSPAIEGAADSLTESLRAAAGAYADLAAAATDGDRSRYRKATRLIGKREAAVERGAAEPLSA